MSLTVPVHFASVRPYAAFCLALFLASTGATLVAASETLQIEVREPAGIRRFGYPVAVVVPIPPTAPKTTVCSLHDADRLVPAQLRREETDDGAGRWWLDFNLYLMPHESRTLKLEYGERLATNSEPRSGLTISEMPEGYTIKNGEHLTWTTGREHNALVKQVRAPTYDHLRETGVKLALYGRDGARHEVGGEGEKQARTRIVRSGPLVVALREEVALTHLSAQARSVVDMTFPSSKSWVQVEWRIEDGVDAALSASAEIDLNLDSPTTERPTLVDFGASTLVYMAIDAGQVGLLRSVPRKPANVQAKSVAWEVLRGPRGKPAAFVSSSTTDERRTPAEGWAHVMDRTRCLAVALDEFGEEGDDSIEVVAEGKVIVTRRFLAGAAARPEANRRLRFWLHFVGFPPHQTAATSPQSMLEPLVVRVSTD